MTNRTNQDGRQILFDLKYKGLLEYLRLSAKCLGGCTFYQEFTAHSLKRNENVYAESRS